MIGRHQARFQCRSKAHCCQHILQQNSQAWSVNLPEALPCPALPCPALPCPAPPCPASSSPPNAKAEHSVPFHSTNDRTTHNIKCSLQHTVLLPHAGAGRLADRQASAAEHVRGSLLAQVCWGGLSWRHGVGSAAGAQALHLQCHPQHTRPADRHVVSFLTHPLCISEHILVGSCSTKQSNPMYQHGVRSRLHRLQSVRPICSQSSVEVVQGCPKQASLDTVDCHCTHLART